MDATAHLTRSRRSASMVRNAASRCNRMSAKHSNIRLSSTTVGHEPVASPLYLSAWRARAGSEGGAHANWPCSVPCGASMHGRAWLDDMISTAASRQVTEGVRLSCCGRVVCHCRAGRTETSVHVASRDVPASCNNANLACTLASTPLTPCTVQMPVNVTMGKIFFPSIVTRGIATQPSRTRIHRRSLISPHRT